MFIFSPEVLGIAASVVIALLSLIPVLGKTDQRRNLVAIIVLVIAAFVSIGFEFTTWLAFGYAFAKAAVAALVTYKMFVQNFLLVPAQNKIEDSNR